MKKYYNVEIAYNFEILLSEDEVEKVNNALDDIVWFDGIVNE